MSFDLGAMLADVSKSDTREQIEYIPLENLENDPNNFYQLSGVEDLASNIALCGVQQPIRVRPGQNGHYIIVSGHRRRAALESLAKEDPQRWKEVPCIVERDSVSPALQQLRLIYANANTRTMTSAEVIQQAEQVEKLLYQLKEEGFDFPGRMRDHVAQAVQVSTSKLARLKVIRENLAEEWRPAFQEDKLKESTAYELAKMPEAWQRIFWEANKKDFRHLYADSVRRKASLINELSKMKCRMGRSRGCENLDNMLRRIAGSSAYAEPCPGCCLDCINLRTCSYSCIHAAKKKQELKAQAKAEKQAEAKKKEKRDRPVIEYIQGVYTRIGQLRKEHGVSVEQLYKAAEIFYEKIDDEKEKNLETGKAAISANDHLPFHYGFTDTNAKALCAVADLLHCSVDYLLGRSSDPEPQGWQTGTPWNIGTYAIMAKMSEDGDPVLTYAGWSGEEWLRTGEPIQDYGIEVLSWIELPEVE